MSGFLSYNRALLQPVNGLCPNCDAKAVDGTLLCGCREKANPYHKGLAAHFTLKEKQEYYEYSSQPYRFKEAPKLNPELVQALKNERLDKTYRFVWGGVVLVREEPNSPTFTIARGDRNACYAVSGVFMPKYQFARARQARGFFYTDSLNRTVSVLCEEFIPKGYISRVDYRYVDFGILRWFVEQRTSGQALVDSGVYNPHEQVPEEDWIALSPFAPMETKLHRYYEPGLEMVEILQKREWQNQNADLRKVAAQMMQQHEKARIAKERDEAAKEKASFDELFNDVVRDVERKRVYST